MELVIISGRSGSGKSTALHQLEDIGYYCVDNLPAGLLQHLTREMLGGNYTGYRGIAVCIDARNSRSDLGQIDNVLSQLSTDISRQIVFLDADESVLIKRFSETRRKHPLSDADHSLAESIASERELLEPLAAAADLTIDTTESNIYDLRAVITSRLGQVEDNELSLLIESFGFKRGVPADADLMFDARLLVNPHWKSELRPFTGRDSEVAEFLQQHSETDRFVADIVDFLSRWLPHYEASQRRYMTVAIGCTGGQHRSVFVAEQVHRTLSRDHPKIQLRHRDLTEITRP
ncbi:conserved hypothetical protein [Luminiphilus syltensis NOR5-1B]|uniref:Uncharacterized protein n=1 Tax=Luminiphilus syltensis NOR5-1B TaxID=565045 RepID=B8KR89_9GAMM|nr:RNase adapter RapZ [Luminiphilus syltensis]EED35333.1 conserved hypothetical protein [Luminiphilus syltensis NOR5-1B]